MEYRCREAKARNRRIVFRRYSGFAVMEDTRNGGANEHGVSQTHSSANNREKETKKFNEREKATKQKKEIPREKAESPLWVRALAGRGLPVGLLP